MLCQHVVREEHVNKKEASGAPQFSSRPEANTNTRCRCDKCHGRNQRSHHRQDIHEREQQTGGQLLIPYLLQTIDNEPCSHQRSLDESVTIKKSTWSLGKHNNLTDNHQRSLDEAVTRSDLIAAKNQQSLLTIIKDLWMSL